MSRDVWHIEKIVPGGAGMARLEGGLIGFAEGALPGETIVVERREVRKGHVRALAFQVLEPAVDRVEPPCPFATKDCGCDFMHVSAPSALTHKVEALRDALSRVGKLGELPEIVAHASPQPLGYRSRLRVHISPDGRVGYHARRSHQLLEITSCKVARPELTLALERLRETAREHARSAARFSEAELRVAPSDPRPVCWLSEARSNASRGNERGDAFVRALEAHFHVFVGDETSEYVQRWPIAEDLSLLVPPRAFVQVNWEVNRMMIAALLETATRLSAETFLDLYAGAGNFTLALLARGLRGVAVESEPQAARAAERAIAERALSGGSVLHADSVVALTERPRLADVDLAVLDPPRAGAKALLEALLRARPRAIAYFSCDPVTLARDLGRVTAEGYALERLSVFDMFPGTHHMETLAVVRS